MLSLRSHALITAGFFAGLLAVGWGGNLLDALGLFPHDPVVQIGALVLVLGLCAGLAFSAVPLMILTVLRFQVSIGNANRPIIRTMIARTKRLASNSAIFWRKTRLYPHNIRRPHATEFDSKFGSKRESPAVASGAPLSATRSISLARCVHQAAAARYLGSSLPMPQGIAAKGGPATRRLADCIVA